LRIEWAVGLWRDGPALHGHHGKVYIYSRASWH
jgi:hypothetical protein